MLRKPYHMVLAFRAEIPVRPLTMGELTDWFRVNSGTGQKEIQGPEVFNFCLNFAGFLVTEESKTISHNVFKKIFSSLLDTDYVD